jgi:hypothetical protein
MPDMPDVKATETAAYIFFALLFASSFLIGFWLQKAEKKHQNKLNQPQSNSDLV